MLLDPNTFVPASLAAVDDLGQQISYGSLAEQGLRLAQLVEPRSLVFCLCENNVGGLLGYTGMYDNNSIPLLLDASLNRALLQHLIDVYKPSHLWVPETYSQEFRIDILHKAYNYVLGKTENSSCAVHDSLSLLLTTSGSTGSPKLVRHRYGNLEANARNVAIAFGWTSKERPICSLPMQYTMGLNVINTHLYVGATLLLTSESLTSPRFWDFIQKQRGSNFTGVPYSYDVLFKLKFTRMSLPHLTTLAVGGGKMSEKNFNELATYAAQNGKRLFSSFGTTETSARMACLQPEYALSKCCSIGKAIPEGELFLRDDAAQVINDAEAVGELCYRGPNVTMGYAECREDLLLGDEFSGEYATGDLARRDADGFYFITGRMTRFVKIFGLRISLDQCEHIIHTTFNSECACTGTDNKVTIYLTGDSLPGDIKKFIAKFLQLPPASFEVYSVSEIPKNESGKILYSNL